MTTATEPTTPATPENKPEPTAAEKIWGDVPATPVPAALDPTAELTAALTAAQMQAEQHRQDYLRALAEADNQRRRNQREIEQSRQFALERFAQALLPVSDALELAVAAAQEPSADVTQLREGDTLTLKLLCEVLGKFGITEVNPLHERFNPEHHEAMGMEIIPGAAPNSVARVFQKGYLLNGRLLRPARVIIAKPE